MMDKSYFEKIYTKYFKVLFFFSLRIVESPSAAEDIVQDIFTECWINRKKIDISYPIKPYLYKLTYNRSLDYLKLAENKNLPLPEKASVLNQILYATFSSDEQLNAKEVDKEIVACVENLPEKCREVFLLSRYDNLKNKEIAEKLNINIKTVEKHIGKALGEIRNHLSQAGYLFLFLL